MEFVDFSTPSTLTSQVLPYEQVVFAPIGDVHFDDRGFAKGSFQEYLNILNNEYDNVFYIGMGDYLNVNRTTVRKAFKNLEADDGNFVDEYVESKRQGLLELLSHTKGRWLGMLQGNHTWEYRDGSTTESRLCADLDAQFLHDCADIQVSFDGGTTGDKRRGSVGIWAHHGVGGRKFPVGKLLDHVCPHFPNSDIFLMGHTHVREYRDFVKLHRIGGRYVERSGVAVITGGWVKGYTAGPPNYVERKAMAPLAIGSIIIKVRPRMHRGYFAPRIRVESI